METSLHPIEEMNAFVDPKVERTSTLFAHVLSLGHQMDARGRRWALPSAVAPRLRLEFALAVFSNGGLYVLIDVDRGFLCTERITLLFAQLQNLRGSDSYRVGHAFARLHDALGYGNNDMTGYSLIEDPDLQCPAGFIKGFCDATVQIREACETLRGCRNPSEVRIQCLSA